MSRKPRRICSVHDNGEPEKLVFVAESVAQILQYFRRRFALAQPAAGQEIINQIRCANAASARNSNGRTTTAPVQTRQIAMPHLQQRRMRTISLKVTVETRHHPVGIGKNCGLWRNFGLWAVDCGLFWGTKWPGISGSIAVPVPSCRRDVDVTRASANSFNNGMPFPDRERMRREQAFPFRFRAIESRRQNRVRRLGRVGFQQLVINPRTFR